MITKRIIPCLDVSAGGMVKGVSFVGLCDAGEAVNIPIIAGGGKHSVQDVKDLHATNCKGISGTILGRSIYEGTIVLGEAQGWLDTQSPSKV